MIALGLDPSLTAYGWAIHDSSSIHIRRVSSGHEETLPSTVPVARFMHFRAMVNRLLSEFKPEVVGIESPAYSAGPFQTIHFGLMMFSLEAIFERRIDCVLFDPATVKLLAKGDPKKSGKMAKLDMQRRVQLDTKESFIIDNNEADAYCVGMFASRLSRLMKKDLNPEDLSESEKHVFLSHKKTRKDKTGTKVSKNVAHVFRENSRFYRFSQIPQGSVSLPKKSDINKDLISYLNSLEETNRLWPLLNSTRN